MANKTLFIVISFLFLGSTNLYGWGVLGHRTSALIAHKNLSHESIIKLKKLFKRESLVDMSTWADEIRSSQKEKYKKFLPWHYATVPKGQIYKQLLVKSEGDVLIAIRSIIKELKATPFNKMIDNKKHRKYFRIKVKLLVHFIADLHQPLHIGNGEDKGANLCLVNYFGKVSSLHSVWDSLMIERMKYSYTELADYLMRYYQGKLQVKSSILNKEIWLNESAKIRLKVYPKSKDGKIRQYCVKNFSELSKLKKSKDTLNKIPTLSYAYDFKKIEIIKSRLYLSGIRLSHILNDLFSK